MPLTAAALLAAFYTLALAAAVLGLGTAVVLLTLTFLIPFEHTADGHTARKDHQ